MVLARRRIENFAASLKGTETRDPPSRCEFVLVDQPAEDVASAVSAKIQRRVVCSAQSSRWREIQACCPVLLDAPPAEQEAVSLAKALKVLADPAWLRLVSAIAAQLDAEACVCNLTGPLGLSQSTVSHHLKVLSEAGILGREQRGRWAYYRLVPERSAS
jgi:ArsR family transcriptional regulator, arsenate/arsenite/antimonite-responsive transcriptional repressor